MHIIKKALEYCLKFYITIKIFFHRIKRMAIFFIQPLKMVLTEGFETSAKLNLTPGKYPKENIQDIRTA
jgi:hypothetical protein